MKQESVNSIVQKSGNEKKSKKKLWGALLLAGPFVLMVFLFVILVMLNVVTELQGIENSAIIDTIKKTIYSIGFLSVLGMFFVAPLGVLLLVIYYLENNKKQ